MTIHSENPFADPDPDPVRRLRGRVGGVVSLWTAGAGQDRAGLTVSSFLVVTGEPGRVIGLLDPDSDLADRLLATGHGVVQLLGAGDHDLSEAFAGVAPAPGGVFRLASFVDTSHGPRLETASTWALVSVESSRDVGWSLEVTTVIDELLIGDDEPLVHRRGRYHSP